VITVVVQRFVAPGSILTNVRRKPESLISS